MNFKPGDIVWRLWYHTNGCLHLKQFPDEYDRINWLGPTLENNDVAIVIAVLDDNALLLCNTGIGYTNIDMIISKKRI